MKQLALKIKGRWCRERAKWGGRALAPFSLNTPLVSFTFDDFPRSAWATGGALLSSYGLKGTYYVSLGLLGQMSPTGEIAHLEDVEAVAAHGHELGCHTFDHRDAWETEPDIFAGAILCNRKMLAQINPDIHFQTFSYPISPPRPANKVCTRHFICSRGGGQTFNSGPRVDLNYLQAFFLDERNRSQFGLVEEAIARNAERKGWLIFATHDVSDSPTRYGCSPSFFEHTIRLSLASGARVLPVSHACRLATAL